MSNSTQLRTDSIRWFIATIAWKRILLLWLLVLLLSGCAGISSQASGPLETSKVSDEGKKTQLESTGVSKSCPVTRQPELAFIPPEPYKAGSPVEELFWYGSPALWTLLPYDGAWRELPYNEESGYTNKVLFWRDGYDPAFEPQPELTLRGVRLDGSGESFTTSETTHAMAADIGSAMLVGVDIPAPGCWQFTASYKGEDLSFTLLVQP